MVWCNDSDLNRTYRIKKKIEFRNRMLKTIEYWIECLFYYHILECVKVIFNEHSVHSNYTLISISENIILVEEQISSNKNWSNRSCRSDNFSRNLVPNHGLSLFSGTLRLQCILIFMGVLLKHIALRLWLFTLYLA